MCSNVYKLTLFLAIFGYAFSIKSAPSYTLVSVADKKLVLSVHLGAQQCTGSTPHFIAFSSVPKKPFSAVISYANGRKEILSTHTAGWAGNDYIQWCSFIPTQTDCNGANGNAVITISFSEPIYRGVKREKVTCRNGRVYIPLTGHPAKSAVTFPSLPYRFGLRISVSQDGIYVLTGKTLQEHGVHIERIPLRTYRLFERDREIPLYLPNEHHTTLTSDDRILFYGEKLRTADGRLEHFSETNVYWLTWGDAVGARVAVVSGARRTDPTVFTVNKIIAAREYLDTLHIEFDNSISWLGNIDGQPFEELTDFPESSEETTDNWYWGGVGATELTNFSMVIPSPVARASARISIGFMGMSSIDSVAEDHRVDVFINDKPAGERHTARWDGQREFVFESDTFSTDNLENGVNRLTLQTSETFTDRSTLNWVEVAYYRGYGAYEDRVSFKNNPSSYKSTVEYTLAGFSTDEIELWDVKQYRFFKGMITERGSGKERGSRVLIFQDSIGVPVRYLAQTIDRRITPETMCLDTVRTVWDSLVDVEYIAISAATFERELEPLLQVHEKRGLRTAFVAIEDIYNRFSYGIRDPESIRRFLQYIFGKVSGNGTSLRYLLLGGDTTHDLDKKDGSRNIVPTHLSRIPGWGPGADDGYFTTVRGDDLFPDLAVGRFPAQNNEEMRLLVDKTIRYIQEPHRGYWRDNLLMLGGGEPIFTQFNDEAISEIISNRMNVIRMDADPRSVFYKDEFVAPQRIADHLNTGVVMVNFNGHGGGNIWSDNNFFGYDDLVKLHNGQWGNGGRLPVVFSFTCLTGFFESTTFRSLGEEFIRTGNDGAIGFYGASAYTSRNGNLIINKLLLEEALNGTWERLGDFITFCEMSMLVRYNIQYLHLIRQYNLLGDPALPWHMTPDTLHFTQELSDSGTSFTVKSNDCPVRDGEVKISVHSENTTWNQTIVPIDKGRFSHTFGLKDKVAATLATVRAYAWNDSAEIKGWQYFTKDTMLVHDVTIDPARPFFDDSVTVSCILAHPLDSAAVQLYCLYALSENNTPQVSYTGIAMSAMESGQWQSIRKIALPFTGSVNHRLLVYFRAIGATTLQSPVFTFPIGGRPDLVFAGKSLDIEWKDDSLRLPVEVLNTGNAVSPPFSIAFIWPRIGVPSDTFAQLQVNDSLPPGTQKDFSVTMPDTQGSLYFYAQLNPSQSFSEIVPNNNRIDGHVYLFYRDLKTNRDTLYIDNDRLCITPVTSLSKTHRLFLFEDTVGSRQPLSTQSKWLSKRDTSAIQWMLKSRPPLNGTDSLKWVWNRTGERQLIPADTVFQKFGFTLFDTLIGQWRYIDGIVHQPKMNYSIAITTAMHGPFAVASISDIQPPEQMVSIYGKTLATLDYTAKNRPFTIFFSDPSGIAPQSISLQLNKTKVPAESYSSIPTSGDLRSITLSMYPERENRIDSLSVQCTDLAGNSAEKTFAYLPGTDLTIKSFTCHPNPFTARKKSDGTISKVRFAFLLTDLATSVTLSIYTVSSKKIKTWKLDELIGYQQVEWDGRDHSGYRIANGTYYAKLEVKNDRKKVKKIIRIAKLEGF